MSPFFSNKKQIVKRALIFGTCFVLWQSSVPHSIQAQDKTDAADPWSEAPPPPPPAPIPETAPIAEELPPPPPLPPAPEEVATELPNAPRLRLEARSFAVTAVKRSRSYRVYRFEDKSGELPTEGKVLLLRRGVQPLMGLRVLKLYSEERAFAAKRILIYDQRRALDVPENYEALEKTGETVVIPPSPQDQRDLKELETPGEVPPPPPSDIAPLPNDIPPPPPPSDGDLAAQDPPPPPPNEETPFPSTEDSLPLESHSAITVDEIKPLDPFSHWLTGQVAAVANYDAASAHTYYISAGLRYGLSLAKSLFLNGPRVQDSLVLEVGASLYQISSYQAEIGDNYSILPLTGTVRYNFQITELLGLYLYGGATKNFITASSNADSVGEINLSQIMPAFGAGAYIVMGPSWNIRIDAGYDTLGAGLMLRF